MFVWFRLVLYAQKGKEIKYLNFISDFARLVQIENCQLRCNQTQCAIGLHFGRIFFREKFQLH